ncbi:MAG TPA: NPCBM/NEW2 domain-containing protein [Verrucomicrobiae bacterium]|nr:NPCBM/NEW2 domain-containing protein [Verrucomicrobiae bacterium]
MKLITMIGMALVSVALTGQAKTGTFGIESLDLRYVDQGWGYPQVNKSLDGHAITIAGQKFEHGLGTHAASTFRIDLGGAAERFTAMVGVDDDVKHRGGSVIFRVVGDGKVLWESGVMRAGTPAKAVNVELRGVKQMVLNVGDADDGTSWDHADWAEAEISMAAGQPKSFGPPQESAVILTPKPLPEPRINGARVLGVRPGSPFLFTVPASGDRPMTFTADPLPAGLKLDPQTGQMTGTIGNKGVYVVTLKAKNALGEAERSLKIVCGDTIALTPPLGWNSWNCFGRDVTAADVRAAADAMVASGLIEHGWTYINIDDCWQGGRDTNGNILSSDKFPDMKALTDYVHGKGLKIGIYSSPGPQTCAHYEGSYRHEEQDARRYAEWGFDYLKYDWCSYDQIAPSPDHDQLMKPYQVMSAALNSVPRDVVFSLCQYGMGNVWEWGAQAGGNCWRTGGDITDTWSSMSVNGFRQAGLEKFAGPGHWNDPDMLVVGYVGWSAKVRPTRLLPNEQYTHISLWCLLGSPLLIGCDMTKLDAFTLSLLTNEEVLALDQDPLGRQAARVAKAGQTEVWSKDLEDGSKAVGLFNLGEEEAPATVKWPALGLAGPQTVRNLWRQKDLGTFNGEFQASVPRHGVVLIRLIPR